MLDAVPRATAFGGDPFRFVAACWWGLPVDDVLLPLTRTRRFATKKNQVVLVWREMQSWMEGEKLRLINARAFEICCAMKELNLPALLMLMIVDEACPLAGWVTMFHKWAMIAKIKNSQI
jgi:hypothetical protein